MVVSKTVNHREVDHSPLNYNSSSISSMLLTSFSVAALVGGFVWGNYSHAGCWALIGSGALGTLSGLVLTLKNYGKKEKIQPSTSKKNPEVEEIETSKSSRKIQLPLEDAIKKGHYILAKDALQRGERPKMYLHYGPQILWDLIRKDPSSTALNNFCTATGRIYDQTRKEELIFHFYNEMFQLLRSFDSLSYDISCGEKWDLVPYNVALGRGSLCAAHALILNHIETNFFDWEKAFKALILLPNDAIMGSQAVDFFRLSLQKFKCLPGHILLIPPLQSLYGLTLPSQHQNVREIFHLACVAALRNEKSQECSLYRMSQRGLDVNHPSIVDFFLELVINDYQWNVSRFIEQGINLNQPDSQGRLPLHEAARANHLSLVEYLLDNGADKQKLDRQGHLADEVVSNENMRSLIVNWTEADARLHKAAETKNLVLLQSALNDGADIHCKRSERTVLEKALRANQFTVIKFLVEKGDSIKEFQSPISLLNALRWHPLNDDDLRQFCTETGQEFSIENRRALIFDYYDKVISFFFDKKELERLDERGCTPLLEFIQQRENLKPLSVEHYLICCGGISNSATSSALTAAAFYYLTRSNLDNIDYKDALHIWNSLIKNIDVFAKIPRINFEGRYTIFTLFQFTENLIQEREDLKKLHFEVCKKGIEQLVNSESPQNEQQRKLQQEYLSDIVNSYSFYSQEDKPFMPEMFAKAVDNGHLHLIPALSEFVNLDAPWNGLTPLQRAKSDEMKTLLIKLRAKEGS